MIKAFRSNFYIISICSMSFAHLKNKFLLEQWKNLEFHYFIITHITKNVFRANLFDVLNEKLFFVVNKIYKSHKFYHSATIKIKIIIRQHNNQKNEWKLKNTLSDLKKKQNVYFENSKKKDIRNQVLRDKTKDYINDVDEIWFFIVSINKITTRCVCLKCLINVITNQEKKRIHSIREFTQLKRNLRSKINHRK